MVVLRWLVFCGWFRRLRCRGSLGTTTRKVAQSMWYRWRALRLHRHLILRPHSSRLVLLRAQELAGWLQVLVVLVMV